MSSQHRNRMPQPSIALRISLFMADIPEASKEHSFLLFFFCARFGKNCSLQKYRTFVKNVLDSVWSWWKESVLNAHFSEVRAFAQKCALLHKSALVVRSAFRGTIGDATGLFPFWWSFFKNRTFSWILLDQNIHARLTKKYHERWKEQKRMLDGSSRYIYICIYRYEQTVNENIYARCKWKTEGAVWWYARQPRIAVLVFFSDTMHNPGTTVATPKLIQLLQEIQRNHWVDRFYSFFLGGAHSPQIWWAWNARNPVHHMKIHSSAAALSWFYSCEFRCTGKSPARSLFSKKNLSVVISKF